MSGSAAKTIPVYPALRAGHAREPESAVRIWLEVGWLMLAEGLAYVEDLEGGVDQPEMQQAAKLRLLEQLLDIDNRLAGRVPVDDAHCLALAMEYGMRELLDVTGEELIALFGLDAQFGGEVCDVEEVLALWGRLRDGFPGELPDRLVAQGQRDMLLTLQRWAELARAAGLDVGLLSPLLKEA